MVDRVFGNHLGRLQSALDLASERQKLLTTNLANVNTPGYKRRDIDFHIPDDKAVATLRTPNAVEINSASMRTDGNSIDLEREVLAITETDLRFQAVTELTSRFFSGLRNAIREGR